jgi:hypothetical protein
LTDCLSVLKWVCIMHSVAPFPLELTPLLYTGPTER